MVPSVNILLPVDFSERSLDAARQAEVLARHFQAEVTVLHVVDPHEQESGHFEPGGVKLGELERLLARDFTGASISQVVRDGNPAREILDFAGANQVDLIVMASHGYKPFESFLMGSVAAEVLRDASCPVWITAHAPEGLPPIFRNVLCAVDLGPGSEKVGKVELKLGKEGQILFAGGDVPEAVCCQAKKLQADLVVIGRSPKADDVGITRTTSFTIIRESPCPVVSI